ncbi:Phage-related minor tail protein [Candidatus Ornithobacterium hominis]|uniref:tape measure protein n=1 Tax=Candidatus Ornithobacterium hominis TaxID=2497989 RepID=UPI000E5BCD4A|nr:tape measure protein [Candidatus Ornithobacterium hominis]SZD73693.1 Phage-related minor tail protein [Candidatus Ornithobacterium hominis]
MSYSFSISVKDFATSSLMKVGAVLSVIDNRANRTQTNLQNSFDRTVNSIDSLRGKLDLLNQLRTASTSTKDIKLLTNNIRETERELRRLENLPPMSFRERLRGVAGQFGGLIGLASGFGIAMRAFNGIKSIVQKGVELEQTNVKFEVLLGSAERAKSLLSELNQYANFTPYDNASIQKGAEMMLGYGIAQEKIMPSMKMLGDVAMGNREKLSGLSLVYSQIMATGRLMGQDLLQMINAGFNPLQVITERTGESMESLTKRMEKGEISVEDVRAAMETATGKGGKFQGMLEKIANTPYGQLQNLQGTLDQMMVRAGDVFLPIASKLMDFFSWLSEILGPILEPLTLIFGFLTAGILAAAAAQWFLNLAVWSFPGTWIIAAIIAIIGVITYLIIKTNGWGEAWKIVVNNAKLNWEVFTSGAELLWDGMIDNFMIGLNKIKSAWYEFKNSVGIGDEKENNAALIDIANDTKKRSDELVKNKKDFDAKTLALQKGRKNAFEALKWDKNVSLDGTVAGLTSKLGFDGKTKNRILGENSKTKKDKRLNDKKEIYLSIHL